MNLSFPIPDEFIELVVEQVTAAVIAQLDHRHAEQWPEALTIETAARYTDSSVERLRKLVAQRRISFVQDGHGCAIRFLRSDLDEWLAAQRVEARRSR